MSGRVPRRGRATRTMSGRYKGALTRKIKKFWELTLGDDEDEQVLKDIKSMIAACDNQIDLEDIPDYTKYTTLMVAVRIPPGIDPKYAIVIHWIWEKYHELGCNTMQMRHVLNRTLNSGPGPWSVFMHACKSGNHITLRLVWDYYRNTFRNLSREDLAQWLQQDHLDLSCLEPGDQTLIQDFLTHQSTRRRYQLLPSSPRPTKIRRTNTLPTAPIPTAVPSSAQVAPPASPPVAALPAPTNIKQEEEEEDNDHHHHQAPSTKIPHHRRDSGMLNTVSRAIENSIRPTSRPAPAPEDDDETEDKKPAFQRTSGSNLPEREHPMLRFFSVPGIILVRGPSQKEDGDDDYNDDDAMSALTLCWGMRDDEDDDDDDEEEEEEDSADMPRRHTLPPSRLVPPRSVAVKEEEEEEEQQEPRQVVVDPPADAGSGEDPPCAPTSKKPMMNDSRVGANHEEMEDEGLAQSATEPAALSNQGVDAEWVARKEAVMTPAQPVATAPAGPTEISESQREAEHVRVKQEDEGEQQPAPARNDVPTEISNSQGGEAEQPRIKQEDVEQPAAVSQERTEINSEPAEVPMDDDAAGVAAVASVGKSEASQRAKSKTAGRTLGSLLRELERQLGLKPDPKDTFEERVSTAEEELGRKCKGKKSFYARVQFLHEQLR